MKLSIIVPVFNEEKTIGEVLHTLKALKISGFSLEIIVIDDGSTDATASVVQSAKLSFDKLRTRKVQNLKIIAHKKNMGKGAAVRTGVQSAKGDYIIIQDADLEYSPKEIHHLLRAVLENNADVVYGTRLKRLPNLRRDERTLQFLLHYFGNRFLSLLTSILYGQWITDMETGYKVISKQALETITIRAKGFELEPEITAKLMKRGYHIHEVPISTNPRGYKEGKKLHTVKDGCKALWALVKYRVSD